MQCSYPKNYNPELITLFCQYLLYTEDLSKNES